MDKTILLFFILTNLSLFGQSPNIQHFSTSDFQGAAQTWAVSQDEDGLLFFANSDGILIYDGIDWELVSLPNKTLTENVYIDAPTQVVYVGGYGQFGYLERLANGEYQYRSLVDKIEADYRKFTRVAYIMSIPNGVAFISNKTLYLYTNGAFNCLPLAEEGRFFKKGNQILLRLFNNRYYELIANELVETTSEAIFGLERVVDVCPYQNEGEYLAISKGKVQLITEQGSSQAFPLMDGEKEYEGIFRLYKLANDRYLFDLLDRTALVTDQHGKLLWHFTAKNGLAGTVMNLFEDRDNHLWILTSNGISYAEIGSPFTKYDEHHGLGKATVLSLHRTEGLVYAGTSRGLYYRSAAQNFEPVLYTNKRVTTGELWNFKEIHGRHLVASGYGVYDLKNNEMDFLVGQRWVHALGELAQHKNAFLFGTYADGLFAAILKDGNWTKQKVKGFEEEIRFIEEDQEGNVWISHYNKGIFKLKLSASLDSVLNQTFYSIEEGLPSKENNRIFKLANGELVVTTINGFYQYDKAQDRFISHAALNASLPENFCIYNIHESNSGDLWLWAAELSPAKVELGAVLRKQGDGSYLLEKDIFYKIKKEIRGLGVDIDAPILSLENGGALFGYGKEIIKYDPVASKEKQAKVETLFKRINFGDSSYATQTKKMVNLPYERNDFEVEVALPFYEAASENLYRFKLKGYKKEWSPWSHNSSERFTNLPEGRYTLTVEAKNVYGNLAQTASYDFYINPPLSRTWWAYLLYLVLLGLAVFAIVRWNTRRLIKQKESLEQIVAERTKELQAQTEELFQMNEEIQTQRNYLEESNIRLSDYNTKIKNSINAAKIIQEALLPFGVRMNEAFDDHFLFYKPKDIVSGDFYWLSQLEEHTFIAVIDCTGHGVPGAFMSMLAYSLLNEIIDTHRVTNPGEVLNRLNIRVNYALSNSVRRSKGGMDIGICKLTHQTNGEITIDYAGAKRPLYYTQGEVLNKLEGNRLSVGVVDRKKRQFSTVSLTLTKGETIYLSTDGYADEPNPNRKKYGTPRFEALLQRIHKLPLQDQKEALNTELMKYRQDMEQRDDITIVGIKL